MKFAYKLTLVILSLLSVALSLGGTWTIYQNFSHVQDEMIQQSSRQQLRQRYTLETKFSQAEDNSSHTLYSLAMLYAEEEQGLMAEAPPSFSLFGENGMVLYSNMPHNISYSDQQQAIGAGETKVRFIATDEHHYLLLATPLRGMDRSIWLVDAYDVTSQFSERDRQIRQHMVLQFAALVLTGAAAGLISTMLTRSLKKLSAASRALSNGETGIRVEISSGDELEQLGKTFNGMADAIETQMRLLQQETDRQKRFVAAFTHELKTPMTAILGYSNLLLSGEQPAQKRQKAADYIYHESKRLESLCQELLILLGLEKGGICLQPVSVTAVYGDVRRSLPESFIHLDMRCEEKIAVQADRTLLVTLIRNLVLNAAVAEPKDKMVTIRCIRQPDGIRLTVEDHGKGIPPQELSRITEPFYRVDKSRARENGGSGLGLSICSMIAQLHQSRLEFDSCLGEGTRVSILLKEAQL